MADQVSTCCTATLPPRPDTCAAVEVKQGVGSVPSVHGSLAGVRARGAAGGYSALRECSTKVHCAPLQAPAAAAGAAAPAVPDPSTPEPSQSVAPTEMATNRWDKVVEEKERVLRE